MKACIPGAEGAYLVGDKDIPGEQVIVAPHNGDLELLRGLLCQIELALHGIQIHSIMRLLLGLVIILDLPGHVQPAQQCKGV